RFLLYSLATSLVWEIGRATTTALGIVLLGRPVLSTLRRGAARAGFVPAATGGPDAVTGGPHAVTGGSARTPRDVPSGGDTRLPCPPPCAAPCSCSPSSSTSPCSTPRRCRTPVPPRCRVPTRSRTSRSSPSS